MSNTRKIKRRIKSVQNISKVTHAMQAVSASKVRRAQAHVLSSRPYARLAWRLMIDIASQTTNGTSSHPLLEVRTPIKEIVVLVITSDRGLAGAYNTNILRAVLRFEKIIDLPVQYITVGRKGRDFLMRQGRTVCADFINQPDDPSIQDITPIARLAMDMFLSGQVDEVHIAYTNYINTLTQNPVVLRMLPIKPYKPEETVMAESLKNQIPRPPSHRLDYVYEPSATAIFDLILPRFTELMIYQSILESHACEHSARMVAMRNASDNAEELADTLTLTYNKARQLAITSEMLDIVGGAEALD